MISKTLKILTVIFTLILYGCSLKKIRNYKCLGRRHQISLGICGCLSLPCIIQVTFLSLHLHYTSNKLGFFFFFVFYVHSVHTSMYLKLHMYPNTQACIENIFCLQYIIASNMFSFIYVYVWCLLVSVQCKVQPSKRVWTFVGSFSLNLLFLIIYCNFMRIQSCPIITYVSLHRPPLVIFQPKNGH